LVHPLFSSPVLWQWCDTPVERHKRAEDVCAPFV
jgi:hypothetical protein